MRLQILDLARNDLIEAHIAETMIVGVGWYSAEAWTMLKLLADDPESLDSTYDQWCAGAEKAFQELQKQPGIQAVKVPVDIEDLRKWCRDQGRRLDGQARALFIAEKVRTMSFDKDY